MKPFFVAPFVMAFLLLIALALVPGVTLGQLPMPDDDWTVVYGGNKSDVFYSAAPAADGGYLILGATNSFGNGSWDAYLTRVNVTGGLQWQKAYGGSAGEWCYGLKQTTDGNYVFVGGTSSFGQGGFDVWLVKVDQDGNELWRKTFGGQYYDVGFNLDVTNDGGLIITGRTGIDTSNEQLYLIKTDANGSLQWEKKIGAPGISWGKAVIQMKDEGYAVAGWQKRAGQDLNQLMAVKTDSQGNVLWEKEYGGARDDPGYGVAETSDGGLLFAGHTTSYGHGLNDIYVVRTDALGNELWNRTYGGALDDFGGAIFVKPDGYVFGGYGQSFGDYFKFALYGTDLEGNVIWNASYGYSNTNVSGSVWSDSRGGYLLVGNTNTYASGKDDGIAIKLAGNQEPAAAAPDLTRKATVVVAAVAVGSGLGLLGLFLGRLIDVLVSILNKVALFLGNFLPIDTVFDFFFGLGKTYSKSMIFRKISQIENDQARSTIPFLKGFSSRELVVILAASALLGLAYLISKKMNLLAPENLLLYCVMAGFVVILHDLAHRYFAHKYQTVVEYKFWGLGTLIMFATAFFFGIVYAVPARTLINDVKKLGLREQAIIYLAGPALSSALAIAFIFLLPVGGYIQTIALLGISMNLLSAVYSLMPIDPLDGKKVFVWKKYLWAIVFIPLLVIYIMTTIFMM